MSNSQENPQDQACHQRSQEQTSAESFSLDRAAEQSPKRYSLTTAISLIIGICVGSGIFFKADNVLVATQGSILLGVVMFCIAALYIVFGGLSLSVFAKKAGGTGGFIDYAHSFINKRYARVIGWMYAYVYLPSVIAVIFWASSIYFCMAIGFSANFEQQILIALAFILLFTLWNILWPRLSGWLQNSCTIFKIAPLIAVGLLGIGTVLFGAPNLGGAAGALREAQQASVHAASSWAWLAAAAPIAFSFDGWPAATSISHELKNSRRNLPIALVVAPLVILLLYLGYFLGLSICLGPQAVIEAGDGSLSLLMVSIFGEGAASWPNLIAMIAIMGTGNALVLSAMRVHYANAVKKAAPLSTLSAKINPRLNFPLNAALVSLALSLIWLAVHYVITHFNLIPNGDISEISVSFTMLMMLPFFPALIRLWRRGEAPFFRGFVAPTLATVGCLFVGISSLFDQQKIPFLLLEIAILCFVGLIQRHSDHKNR